MTPDDSDREPDDGKDVEVRIVDEPDSREDGGFDRRLIDLLGRLLDTDTRGKIYVQVRRDPGATSEEVARGTGLYPETVRRTIADLREEGVLSRRELEGEEGRYGYTAIPPTDLAGRILGELQDGLEILFKTGREPAVDPVTIEVEEASSDGIGRNGRTGDDGVGEVDGADEDGEEDEDGFPAGER